jgi:Nuclease-related domain
VDATENQQIQGRRGEQHVAALLDALRADGWRILHDLDTGRGNIDHVAIGPGGVFVIETKTWRPPWFKTDGVSRKWLDQAYAQCKTLETLCDTRVEPIIAVVKAWLGKPVTRRRGVLILSERMLPGQLRGRGRVLRADEIDAVHQRITAAFSA